MTETPSEDLRATEKDPPTPGSERIPAARDLRKTIEGLRHKYEQAEGKALKLQTDRDEAIAKVRGRYDERLRSANDEAAHAQKVYLDAEAAGALRDRPDREAVAKALGLTLE